MFNILIIEDDIEIRKIYSNILIDNGYKSIEASNGEEALKILEDRHIDLIISDIMMPIMNGYEVTELIRNSNLEIPILIITAKDNIESKKNCFSLGVDDYMIKPIDLNEMIWRIKALLRRFNNTYQQSLSIGNTIFNYVGYSVITNNIEIVLPPKEFLLLYKLISTPNKIFTKIELMEEIWGVSSETTTHSVEVHIGRLRQKFKKNIDFEIITIRGLGYKAVIK